MACLKLVLLLFRFPLLFRFYVLLFRRGILLFRARLGPILKSRMAPTRIHP